MGPLCLNNFENPNYHGIKFLARLFPVFIHPTCTKKVKVSLILMNPHSEICWTCYLWNCDSDLCKQLCEQTNSGLVLFCSGSISLALNNIVLISTVLFVVMANLWMTEPLSPLKSHWKARGTWSLYEVMLTSKRTHSLFLTVKSTFNICLPRCVGGGEGEPPDTE